MEELLPKKECIHSQVAMQLCSIADLAAEVQHGGLDNLVIQLSTSPLYVAVHDSTSFGIITSTSEKHSLKCVSCTSKVTHCSHITAYRAWMDENGMSKEPTPHSPVDLTAISMKAIPYPLTDELKEKFEYYEYGNPFPKYLIPSASAENTCKHGNKYDVSDPVANGWILTDKAVIHKKNIRIENVSICYRPTTGTKCNCTLTYDGQSDLLLNLDNRRLFYYGWLFDILHNTQQTRFPLAAAMRSSSRTRKACGLSNDTYINHMRHAYNAFVRLLDLDYEELYSCKECGPNVECVIMDGIMMGCRQDLMPKFPTEEVTTKPLDGCSLSDRILLQRASLLGIGIFVLCSKLLWVKCTPVCL
jgi:hypothetical protein